MTDPHKLARAYLAQLARVYGAAYAARRRLTWSEPAGFFVLTVLSAYTASVEPVTPGELKRETRRLAGLPDGETA